MSSTLFGYIASGNFFFKCGKRLFSGFMSRRDNKLKNNHDTEHNARADIKGGHIGSERLGNNVKIQVFRGTAKTESDHDRQKANGNDDPCVIKFSFWGNDIRIRFRSVFFTVYVS